MYNNGNVEILFDSLNVWYDMLVNILDRQKSILV